MSHFSLKEYCDESQKEQDLLIKKNTYLSPREILAISAVKAFCRNYKDNFKKDIQVDFLRFLAPHYREHDENAKHAFLEFIDLLEVNVPNIVNLILCLPYFCCIFAKLWGFKLVNFLFGCDSPTCSNLISSSLSQVLKAIIYIPLELIEIPCFFLTRISEKIFSNLGSLFKANKNTIYDQA